MQNSSQNETPALLLAVSSTFYSSVLPCVCALGLVGNLSAMAVLNSSYLLGKVPAHRYLTGLAAFSSLYLMIVLLMWAERQLEAPIYARSQFGCKVLTWLGHACDFASAWLAATLTFDRLGALRFRGHKRLAWLFTRATAHRATGLIALLGLLWSTWSMYMAELIDVGEGVSRCSYASRHYDLFEMFHIMDTLVRFTESSTTDSSQRSMSGFKRARRAVRPAELRLSRTLLVLTTAFLLLNFPSYCMRLLNVLRVTDPTKEVTQWVELVSMMLYYLHHAFLFILYIILSPQVRSQISPTLCRLLECRQLQPGGFDFMDGQPIEPLLVHTASTTVYLVRRSL